MAETLFLDYHRQNHVDIKVIRIFNTYGPRMDPNDGRVISNFIVQALKGEDITIYGDGRQTRSFCYVDDLIEGIRMHKFAGVGLDVYEEETDNVFEDRSDEILEHSTTARLLSFPNVMITSRQGFFTREALQAIADITLQNAMDYEAGKKSSNDVI